MYYTGVGSRSTPPEMLGLMTRIAASLEKRGYILRSGGAGGADTAFASGCSAREIYLPWSGFNGVEGIVLPMPKEAAALASKLHPNWANLSQGAQKLMSRNSHQVLGTDLKTPSEFVVCWTSDGAETGPETGRATGGTGLAIRLAHQNNVPVFNLGREGALGRLRELVRSS